MAIIIVNIFKEDNIIYTDKFIGPEKLNVSLLYESLDLLDAYSPFHESKIIPLTDEQILKGEKNYKSILESHHKYSGVFYGNVINYGDLDVGLPTYLFTDTTSEYLVYLSRKLEKLYNVMTTFKRLKIQFISAH